MKQRDVYKTVLLSMVLGSVALSVIAISLDLFGLIKLPGSLPYFQFSAYVCGAASFVAGFMIIRPALVVPPVFLALSAAGLGALLAALPEGGQLAMFVRSLNVAGVGLAVFQPLAIAGIILRAAHAKETERSCNC